MSWSIGGAAVVLAATLAIGCSQQPARQSADAARASLRASTQTVELQLASASAVSDYDRDQDRWRVDVPPPSATRPMPARVVQTASLQPGLSGVCYGPPPPQHPRPPGLLSITQIGLDQATMRAEPADAIEALRRRLEDGARLRSTAASPTRALDYSADPFIMILGVGRSADTPQK